MPDEPMIVRVNSKGEPIDPLPPGYTFAGFYNKGSNYSGLVPRQPQIPPYYQQQQQRQDEQAAAPAWDWRNPPIDPNGKPIGPDGNPLPYGAERFDFFGRPYYGDGIVGWFKGAWSRLTDPSIPKAPMPEDWRKFLTEGIGAQVGGTDAAKLVTTAMTGFEMASAKAEQLAGGEEGRPSALTYIGRGVKELVGGIFTAFQVPAEAAEAGYYGTARGLMDIARTSDLPDLPTFGNPDEQWLADVFNTNYGIIGIPYNLLRAAVSPLSWDDKKAILEQNYQAARIAYSQFGNAALRQEYIRRYRAGENPELLAMEMQNPVAEMAGTLLFDPLNFVGIGGKGMKAGRMLKDADYALKAVDPAIGKVLSEFANVAGDARAAGAIEELSKVNQAVLAATRSPIDELAKLDMPQMKSAIEDMARMGQDYTPWALTASGKRYVVSHQVETITNWLVANHGPQEAIEMLAGMAKSASRDADEALEGLSTLLNAKAPQPFFSKAGYQTRIMLRRLLENEEGVLDVEQFMGQLEKHQDDVMGAAEFLTKKLDSILDDMIPDISKGREAADLVKAAQTGGLLSDQTRNLAKWYDGLSPVVKSLDRFNNGLQGPVGWLNRVFAGIYMGMSPGYALRNALNNTFTTFIDMGPVAGAKALVGSLTEFFKPGRLAAMHDQSIRNWLNVLNRGAQEAFSGPAASLGKKSIFGFAANWATNVELGTAKAISAKSVDRTMRSMLKPGRALPDLTVLMNRGWSKEQAADFANLIVKHYGNVNAARDEFMEAIAIGRMEIVKNLVNWLPPDDVKAFQKFGFYDTLQAAVNTAKSEGDMAKAIEASRGLRQAVQEMAGRLASEVPPIVPEMMDELMGTMANLEKSSLSNEAAHLFQMQMVTNSAVFRAYEGALDAIMHAMGVDPQMQQAARNAWYLSRTLLSGARETSDKFTRDIWFWSDRIKAYVRAGPTRKQMAEKLGLSKTAYRSEKEFYTALWKAVGMEGDEAAIAKALWENPDVLAGTKNIRKAFLDWMWDGHFKGSRIQHWGKARQQYAEMMEEFFRLAKEKGSVSVDKLPDLKRARDAMKTATILDAAEELPTGVIVPYLEGTPPSLPRVFYEQQEQLMKLFDRFDSGLEEAWAQTRPIVDGTKLSDANAYLKAAEPGISQARLTAASVADAERDFALLNYNKKTYMDLAAAYVFPYQFWYSRTYAHWLRRLAYNPEIIAAYGKYRTQLEKIHADQPEWWRYQINTNELLGRDDEHPLYFNLEAAINPLNGLTGVDFSDPYRRVDWWTQTLEDMTKFGPSVWTPIQLATAIALYRRGETEAASRWAGRLIPQTAAIKSASALLHIGGPGGVDFDPSVFFFSGGLDPYERRRVGRALGAMIQDGAISEAQALQAAHEQAGPIWDQAKQQAAEARAPGNLASFFFGVGFKPRSQQEQEIDRMYTDYRMLWANEGNLSPDEFRMAMEQLRDRYKFMDAVLLSRKGGVGRDRQYAYNVLSRIPPGQKTDIAEVAGINPGLFEQFYDTKGHMELWDKTERDRFMAAIVDIGSLLEMPDLATRAEWNQASVAYNQVQSEAKQMFGNDIWQRVDMYYAAKGDTFADQQRAESILNADPQIGEALDYRTERVLFDPLLQAYYGSLDKLRGYYKSQMYDAIQTELGEGVYDAWAEYHRLKNTGQDARAYWNAHPELKRYLVMRDAWEPIIDRSVADLGLKLRSGLPAQFRNDATADSIMQQNLAGALGPQAQPNLSWQEWRSVLPDALLPFIGQANLPAEAQAEIEYIAQQMGLQPEQAYQMMLQALTSNR